MIEDVSNPPAIVRQAANEWEDHIAETRAEAARGEESDDRLSDRLSFAKFDLCPREGKTFTEYYTECGLGRGKMRYLSEKYPDKFGIKLAETASSPPGDSVISDIPSVQADVTVNGAGIADDDDDSWVGPVDEDGEPIDRISVDVRRQLAQEAADNRDYETALEYEREAADMQNAIDEYEKTGVKTVVPHVAHNSGDNEWYTPGIYIDAARRVLGEIDLDPASNPIAQRVVGATNYYTKEDDGLSKNWNGRVWMNPPYAAGLVDGFIAKLCQHVEDGDVTDAIILVNNATETRWFQQAMRTASALCFPQSRIRFLAPDGELGAPLQGQAFLYFGSDVSSFSDVFGAFGPCLSHVQEGGAA